MKTNRELDLINYIETPRRKDVPVKIDEILEARMKEFIRVRRIRRFTFLR
jgi:hypothetical protein